MGDRNQNSLTPLQAFAVGVVVIVAQLLAALYIIESIGPPQ